MNQECCRSTFWAVLCFLMLAIAGCGSSKESRTDVDAGQEAGDGQGLDAGADPDAATDPDATTDPDAATDPDAMAADASVAVVLSEASLTLETPDLSHTLTATVTGAQDTSVTWASSSSYVATVNAAGVVTSVSGGEAIITATSTADPTKTASCTVTIPEPNRARASSYTDPKTITSGPISIIMCGDSLMRTYVPNAVDQAGWGQVLAQFLTSDAKVDNVLANGGRSSRSFYNEIGRWDQVKARLVAAQASGIPTFVFIQFGHNDQKKATDNLGANYLTFASQNQNGTVAGTYYDYLERYIVEARELGGIPVLLTPFVREYLSGSPPTVTAQGQHNITALYAGETTARGDYPAAMKAVGAKHDVPVIDITAWSAAMVEAHALAGTLGYVYISSDQTHVRNLGALLIAQEAVRALNAQGILTSYAKPTSPRLMLDASTLAFGGVYTGNTVVKTFMVTAFGDASGTITVTAPVGYSVSTDGQTHAASATIVGDASYAGSTLSVLFTPTDAVAYNADLTVSHTSLVPDYGNTVAHAIPGNISLTGNGKVAVAGAPATATWPMLSGTAISLAATTDGAISATTATLTGLINKNVANGGARFDTPDGIWPAEGARNESRYVQFTIPVTTGTFTLDSVSVDAGTGGGSNTRWDIVYSVASDFSSPTSLGTSLSGAKDTLVTSSTPGLGVSIAAGQTLTLRVYPYNTSGATSGKSFMLANVVVSGVSN